MKKIIENKLQKTIGTKATKELKKDLEKEIKKDVEKEVQREVKKELRLHHKIYSKTKSSALAFKNELKKHIIVAITASFAFLIALSWRNPIQNSVNALIESAGLVGKQIYIEYLLVLI